MQTQEQTNIYVPGFVPIIIGYLRTSTVPKPTPLLLLVSVVSVVFSETFFDDDCDVATNDEPDNVFFILFVNVSKKPPSLLASLLTGSDETNSSGSDRKARALIASFAFIVLLIVVGIMLTRNSLYQIEAQSVATIYLLKWISWVGLQPLYR